MQKQTVKNLTIIAFVMLLLLAIIYFVKSIFYIRPLQLIGDLPLIFFGAYFIFVSILNFIQTHKSWKKNDVLWKKQLGLSYAFTSLFILIPNFLNSFRQIHDSQKGINVSWSADTFLGGLSITSPLFLFPISILLFILGFIGLKDMKNKPKSYLAIVFLTAILFLLWSAISFWKMSQPIID